VKALNKISSCDGSLGTKNDSGGVVMKGNLNREKLDFKVEDTEIGIMRSNLLLVNLFLL
jgi:cytochrome c-type biogenesis protein CcmE